MSKKDEKENQFRELPKSLQGIETILTYLNERDKKASSIRSISKHTELSMRVTKNILLQLEKFNQIERVVEKNNILPKWRITKFGKKVIKEAQGVEKTVTFPSKEDELLHNIIIPENLDVLENESKETQETITSKLNALQMELSKILGPVLNINNPIFEDLMSSIIKRVKFLRQKVSNLPKHPIASYTLKKKDEKEKKISKEELKFLFIEIYFFNSLILNNLKRISDFNSKLSQLLENEGYSNAYSVAKDLREEIRGLSSLIDKRESIKINSHVLSKEDLNELAKNKIPPSILDEIIELPITKELQNKEIEKIVLKLHDTLNKGEIQVNDFELESAKSIPLFSLYQLILDERPDLDITIEQVELVINSLAEEGYIPGLKIIQGDEDHYLKVVQLETIDISEAETSIISHALKLQAFSLTDMVLATSWSNEKVLEILNNLTDTGILKHSKSLLHGDRWYIVSENNM